MVDEWVEVALALGDRELHVMDHPLAAHSVMRALPLAPTTVPKSPDRRLRRPRHQIPALNRLSA